MLAFGIVFVVAWIGFTVAIESFYERSPIVERYQYVDPIVGGILGLVQAGILIGGVIMILELALQSGRGVLNPNQILLPRRLPQPARGSPAPENFPADPGPA